MDDEPLLTIVRGSLSESACEAVRLSFNPSQRPDVDRLKTLAAAFITTCEGLKGNAGREAAVAVTNMQTASMWAVLAATKGL